MSCLCDWEHLELYLTLSTPGRTEVLPSPPSDDGRTVKRSERFRRIVDCSRLVWEDCGEWDGLVCRPSRSESRFVRERGVLRKEGVYFHNVHIPFRSRALRLSDNFCRRRFSPGRFVEKFGDYWGSWIYSVVIWRSEMLNRKREEEGG